MRKPLLTIALLFFVTLLFAQKTEFSFGGYTTLMHFSGPSATATTILNRGQVDYTNNPYGSKNGNSFGIFVQGQYIQKNNFIIGLQTGTDVLRSKVNITETTPSSTPYPAYATGTTTVSNQYINLNPFIGFRLEASKIQLDLSAGVETAFVTRSYEEGMIYSKNGAVYRTNNNIRNLKTDNRIKLGLAAYYERVSINASYAHGFSDYAKGMIGAQNSGAYTNVLRFGIGFKIF
ncbi:hypothetical protein [Mucilaginibacter phyllosphaerae]|uniref:PorT family protein n=1 Tax=Mucilaginibacter phyllosphaerae TaxID=1812349 RepID=A0A4Y8AJC8_9SPHI|nr:hypothetical protein [Mucilaginibacter phyllosphaerae]MBB3967832.1 hypothetical protein [Mucilaginibacter phyllosphaerae]TEW69124.1 hypothetical protein E2R65_02860 [Mucilaginibacter phyllosphaerae]GGH03012.1 hypothetical protein GCM10007352_05510 [Mucilaginibacter phyllosphaerae]